jgi:3'-5' exoribonuclease
VLREIRDTDFKELTDKFLADRRFVELLKTAPAAKNFHHNYIGGLLEHTLSVCEMALKVIDQYPELNKDLLIAGSFLHDIGKIREFRYDLLIDYTDEGRLLGHLVLGVTMIDEKLTKLKHFPNEKALWLKHLILSHHGQFEFGFSKRPKFLEAFALHLIDDMDAKINGIGRYMDNDKQDGNWTDFNRMFDRYLLKNMTQEVWEEKEPTKLDNGQKVLFSS